MATRPAAAGAGLRALGTLGTLLEASEYGSEGSQVDIDERRYRRRSRG